MSATTYNSLKSTNLTTVILITLLLKSATQTCGEGCLSCGQVPDSGEFFCRVCDLFQFYSKSANGTCQRRPVEYCQIGSLDHFASPCLLCEPKYVLDAVQNKCVSVNLAQVVQDCHRYSDASTCVSCASATTCLMASA